MKIPNAERAEIDAAKLRDYLLSEAHPVGRNKARVFLRWGYSRADWRALEADLLDLVRREDAVEVPDDREYGRKYEVRGRLGVPGARSAAVVSIWIIRIGRDYPELLTAYPDTRQ